jgi:hypothetical protein
LQTQFWLFLEKGHFQLETIILEKVSSLVWCKSNLTDNEQMKMKKKEKKRKKMKTVKKNEKNEKKKKWIKRISISVLYEASKRNKVRTNRGHFYVSF